MADRAISSLPVADDITLGDLFVMEQAQQAKSITGSLLIAKLAAYLDGHGGISSITWETSGTAGDGQIHTGTIHYADGTTSTIVFEDGVKGDKGDQTYVWVKYSSIADPSDGDMTNTPSDYIGIYAGTDDEAPDTASSYTWFKWKGEVGNTGVSITNIQLQGSSGLVDTYRISLSNGNSSNFTVTNGSNIASITLTSTNGLVDTYTVTLTNGNVGGTFNVINAKSIVSITMISGNHAAGSTDVYRILFNDNDTFDFPVYNGVNGTGAVSTVAGIGVSGQSGDVPLIIWGNGAPTSSTAGTPKQLYFDLSSGIMYICTSSDGNGTYSWASMGITVDNAFSSSSPNPVANSVITALLGTVTLNTVAQTITGAINELLTGLNGKASASDVTALQNDVSDLENAAENKILSFKNVPIVAATGDIATISNSAITADHELIYIEWANQQYIRSDVSWVSSAGSFVLSGTCSTATTANVILAKKDN